MYLLGEKLSGGKAWKAKTCSEGIDLGGEGNV